MEKPLWKPELWEPLPIFTISEDSVCTHYMPPVKSFYDYQDRSEAYEVRGILPRARNILKTE